VQPGNSGGALVDERGPAMRDELRGQESRMAGLSFLESVPAVSAKLKSPITADRKFEDVVKSAQDAAVLVWFIDLVGRSLPRRPDNGAAEHRSPTTF
jgi:hypothetical protein